MHVLGPAAFYGLSYYCGTCQIGYSHKQKHSCAEKCPCCFEKHDRSEPSQYLKCTDCNRTFWNSHCLASHKKKMAPPK